MQKPALKVLTPEKYLAMEADAEIRHEIISKRPTGGY
jgi:hypothetical protein